MIVDLALRNSSLLAPPTTGRARFVLDESLTIFAREDLSKMIRNYILQAFNLYDAIAIKALRARLPGKVVESSPGELQIQFGEHSYLFIYRFGSVVFFNMTSDQISEEMTKIKAALGDGVERPTTETVNVTVGNLREKIDFESVELKNFTPQSLRLIAMTVGQSTALEYFEIKADEMLRETSDFMRRLGAVGRVPFKAKALLKFIGSAAASRQHIVSNLAILDPPEEIWRNKELQRFFNEIQQNFDIDLRFRALDSKLSLVQDNIEILTDLVASRRATFLELMVVALIVLEIVLAIMRKV